MKVTEFGSSILWIPEELKASTPIDVIVCGKSISVR